MVFMPVKKPIFQVCLLLKTSLTEQADSTLVTSIYDGIQLMQMQHVEGIAAQIGQCQAGITPTSEGIDDDDAHLGTQVLGVETYDVSHPHGLALRILNDQPHLTVGIDVVAGRCHVVVEGIAAIGNIGSTDIPQGAVVLNTVEHIEVFWFDGPETDDRMLVHSVSF